MSYWNLFVGVSGTIFLLQTSLSADVVLEIEEDVRKPIWNIAHMVNALYQVDYYLDMGANSLEFDIAFDWEGTAKYTYHGIPCDCFRSCLRYENFVVYLNYIRHLTTPGNTLFQENLVLLLLDVKVNGLSPQSKARAGADIAQKLIEHYWQKGTSSGRAYILISIPSIHHFEFVNGFREVLAAQNSSDFTSKIGFDFSGNENLDYIRNTLQNLEISDHIWQGDGITNCLPRGTMRLRDAIRRRDQPGLTYVNKVYWWTVDKMSTMRSTLKMGVDAMITNYPDRLVSILEEEEFSGKLRLATYEDNPWLNFNYPQRLGYLISDAIFTARGGNLTGHDLAREEEDELLYNC